MSSNSQVRRIQVLFYGLPLAGKRTTLRQFHAHVANRSAHVAQDEDAGDDPVEESFDFTIDLGEFTMKALSFRAAIRDNGYQLYRGAQKQMLRDVDAIVVTIDGQIERAEANAQMLADLAEDLRAQGRELDTIPHVFQYNKSDLPNFARLERLNARRRPEVVTSALQGIGVVDLMKVAVKEWHRPSWA